MKLTRLQLKNIIQEQVRELNEVEEEAEGEIDPRLGTKLVTRQQQAKGEFERSKKIRGGETLGQDVTNKERAILVDVEKILTAIAEKDDLNKYRAPLQSIMNLLRKKTGV
jgi:hypothetical protein